MKIEDFMEKVKNSVIEKLGKEYQVTVCKSDKNNGVVCTGLRVQKNDCSVAPLIYLDEHFRQYKNGNTTLSSIVKYVVKQSRKKSPCVDIQQYLIDIGMTETKTPAKNMAKPHLGMHPVYRMLQPKIRENT